MRNVVALMASQKGVNDNATVAAALGLKGWFAPRKETPQTDNTNLTTWHNQVVGGADLTAQSGGVVGKYRTNIKNGLPIVRFLKDVTAYTGNARNNYLSLSGFSIYVVAQFTAWQDFGLAYADNVICADDNAGFFIGGLSSGLQRAGVADTGGTYHTAGIAGAIALNTWYILEAHFTGASLIEAKNAGLSANAVTGTNLYNTGTLNLKLGYSAGIAGTFGGDIGEILFCNVKHTTQQQTDIRNALKSIWSI